MDYGAAFLAQLSCQNWLGALVFTVLGCLTFLVTRKVLHRLSGVMPQVAPYVPPYLLLLLRDRFDSPSLTVSTGWLLAMGLVLAFAVLPLRQSWLRLVVCWFFSLLLFYVAGLWSCLLFVLLGGLFESLRRRDWRLGSACVLSASVAPVWMICFPDTDWLKIVNPWGEGRLLFLAAAFYLFTPLAAVVLALWMPAPAAQNSAGPAVRRGASKGVPARRWFQTGRMRRTFALSLLVFGWAAVWFGFDGPRKLLAQMDCHASRGEYEKVLAAAARLAALDAASEVRLHSALYHTGRLGRDLFSFTNQTGWDLMPALSIGLNACRPQSEILLELGQVTLAEHFAHEALESEGDRPDILRLLAQVNILKNRPKAARIFLNVLGQIPFQRKSAAKCLHDLEANPRLPDNEELVWIRSRMVSSDLPHDAVPTESILLHLLAANRTNRMAFEYLMAHYLLSRQPDKIVKELGRLGDFGYTEIPRHYEEAILLEKKIRGGIEVDLGGRHIRPETIRRFQQFSDAAQRQLQESPEGRQKMAGEFGDTFWHYYFFGKQAVTGKPTVRAMESS